MGKSHSDLKIVYKKLKEIHPSSKNKRSISPDGLQAIKLSIAKFGFNNPILINPKGVIIAGHQRYKAAKLLDKKTVPTITITGLTDDQEDRLRLLDNKIRDFSTWDLGKLRNELKVIASTNTVEELSAFVQSFGDSILEDTLSSISGNLTNKVSDSNFEKAVLNNDKKFSKESFESRGTITYDVTTCPKCKRKFKFQR